jgi:hypothetical protein
MISYDVVSEEITEKLDTLNKQNSSLKFKV